MEVKEIKNGAPLLIGDVYWLGAYSDEYVLIKPDPNDKDKLIFFNKRIERNVSRYRKDVTHSVFRIDEFDWSAYAKYSHLLKRLRMIREEKDLTYHYVGKQLGINRIKMSNIFRGVEEVELDYLQKVSDVIGGGDIRQYLEEEREDETDG